jgi:carbapenem resistance CarG-like protein
VKLCALMVMLTVAAVSGSERAQAGGGPQSEFAAMSVVPLQNGPNDIDLDGDGRNDLVFVAWRENFNAHGSNYATFYRSMPGDVKWELVPFLGEKDTSFESFRSTQGADCVLRDLRVMRSPGTPTAAIVIVIGERDFGQSYADRAAVTFTVYRAVQNGQQVPGAPTFYFRADKTIRSRAKYCDLAEAFASELGLPARR